MTNRADLRRRIAINEIRFIRITDTNKTKAIDAAVEYLTSIMTVLCTKTGSVKTRPPPKSAADVNAPIHMLKIIKPPTTNPGVQSGMITL